MVGFFFRLNLEDMLLGMHLSYAVKMLPLYLCSISWFLYGFINRLDYR